MKNILVIYKDNTAEMVDQKRIKNIRKQMFTYIPNVTADKVADIDFDFELVA